MIPTPLLERYLVLDGEKRRPKKRLCSQACSHHFKNEIKVFPGRVSTKILSSHVCKLPKSWKLCGGSNTDDNFNLTFFILDNVIIPLTLKSSKEIDCFSFNGLFSLAFVKKIMEF